VLIAQDVIVHRRQVHAVLLKGAAVGKAVNPDAAAFGGCQVAGKVDAAEDDVREVVIDIEEIRFSVQKPLCTRTRSVPACCSWNS
jgi:hypothetical protein